MSVQTATTGLLQSIQLMVQHYFPILLALAIAVLGYRTMIGRMEAGELLSFIIYAVFIAAFVAVGSTFYNTYVLQPVIGLPGWWQSWITQGVGGAGGGPATPVTLLDGIYNAIFAAINKMAASASPAPWNWGHDFFIFLVGLIAWWTADIGLWLMFAAVWTTTILSYVMLIVGPVVIPFGLFRGTRQIMLSWVWGLGSLLASLFMSSILLALWQSQLVTLLGVASLTGTPDTDAPGFFQLGFVVLVMGATVPTTAVLAGWMFGGAIDGGLERASYHLSGASARDGALAAGRSIIGR